MLSEAVQSALNEQINFELYSSYTYLAMAAWFEDRDLPGFSNWMRVQVKEELLHVDKFFNYIVDREGRVKLDTIKAPEFEWKSPLDAFQTALEHEREVTRRISALVDLAIKEGDHSTNQFLQWFVTEQVEEEANVKSVVQQLKLVGDQGHALFMVDRELGQRTFVAPPVA